jgi:hypothetical protein
MKLSCYDLKIDKALSTTFCFPTRNFLPDMHEITSSYNNLPSFSALLRLEKITSLFKKGDAEDMTM